MMLEKWQSPWILLSVISLNSGAISSIISLHNDENLPAVSGWAMTPLSRIKSTCSLVECSGAMVSLSWEG